MVIKRSAGQEVQALIGELAADDEVRRETAVARLAVIGTRAVGRLISAATLPAPAPERVGALRALELIGDVRALGPALSLFDATEPSVVVAAVGVTRALLHSKRGDEALDRLVALALDAGRPAAARLAALDALHDMGARVLDPLWERLQEDPDVAVRRRAARERGQSDPLADLEAAAAGALPDDPAAVCALIENTRHDAPLATLHRILAAIRAREAAEKTARARAAWLAARGVVHLALADRESRVALYDLRETFESATGTLPASFTSAAAAIGDGPTLEAIAAACARAAASAHREAWVGQLAFAFRAISERERIGARHAVMKRINNRFPDVAPRLARKT